MMTIFCPQLSLLKYRKSSIKPTGGLIYFKPICGGGGGGWWGCLFNLETTMVSFLHKEREYKVEKLKYKTLKVMQPRIKIKSELPVSK